MIIFIVTFALLFTILPHPLLAQGEFDDRYGHVTPSCDGQLITESVTLDQLIESGTNGSPLSIPCGYHAITTLGTTYNLPNGLEVYGVLEFTDNSDQSNGDVVETIVKTPYILVRGHLQAGTLENPYKSKLRFVLTEFEKEGDELIVNSLSENPLFSNPLNFGEKAFVVYGGTVTLCGAAEKKTIAKLAKSVELGGANTIDVKGKNWSKYWKAGDHLVITATTDITKGSGVNSAREFTLSSTKYISKDKVTRLFLSEEFFIDPQFDSNFARRTVESRNYKGKKKNIVMTAEVYKLTRNIVIQGIPHLSDMTDFIGTDYTDLQTNPLGGHFVIAHTPKKQILHGIEFAAMGQPGILGRYPIHFHSCGNIDPNTVVRHNTIHHSKQRGLVIHATNGLTIKRNNAFWVHNHCYMTEDGYEHSNKFINNIAANVELSAFWMANPMNDMVGNVAANSGSGYEHAENEDGPIFSVTYKIPCQVTGGDMNEDGCTWPTQIPMGKFSSNVAHNVARGILIYPPRFVSFPEKMNKFDELDNFFAWNVDGFAFDSVSANVKFRHWRVVGAVTGLNIDSCMNCLVEKSVFQDVCKGVRIADNNLWNKQHSAVKVTKTVFNGIWNEPQTQFCAPIVFRAYAKTEYVKQNAQIKNVRLYGVERLFSFEDNLEDHLHQVGFFVHNVLSYDSSLAHIAPKSEQENPAYVIRHKYPENLVIDETNSLVNECDESVIGGHPNQDQFFVCNNQCWRPIAIAFKPVLGNDVDISLRFDPKGGGNSFYVDQTKDGDDWCPTGYIHIIQVIPAGEYKIILVDKDQKKLSDTLHNQADIRFYETDERFDGFKKNRANYGCLDSVTLEFNGVNIPVTDFKVCRGYACC